MTGNTFQMGEGLSGAEMERIFRYVQRLEKDDVQPIGFQINPYSPSPTLQRIDIDGDNFTPSSNFFDHWRVTGDMRRCAISRTDPTDIQYGTNNRGDGLTLDGSTGYDIFVERPTHFKLFKMDGDYPQYYFIPYDSSIIKYDISPAFLQRGGVLHPVIYESAFEASLRDDNGTLKAASVEGAQPWTGNGIHALSFTLGTVAFTKGETITGLTSGATGIVVDYHLTSGAWDGTGAGVIYIRQHFPATHTFTSEVIAGSTGSATASGAASEIALTLSNAETYANNIGTGFGCHNIHAYSSLQDLMYLEYGTFDIQTALGRGICDLSAGTGFAGKLTGADSIYDNLADNGTGVGSGTNGQTPICYRGVENPYSHINKLIMGINFDHLGSYNILKRDGTGTPTAILASGSFETGPTAVPLVDGSISKIQTDKLGALAYIPLAVSGSATTYICDLFGHPTEDSKILWVGGGWSSQSSAGPGYKAAESLSFSHPSVGFRFEYYRQS